ncbi:MAG: hypothetical protein WCH62_03295 [Candidatus Omnitrophota bacterium]
MLGSKWIDRIDNIGVWVLLLLVLLFIFTGYGMTKHIMDPVLAKYIHGQILPIPLFILFVIHVLKPIHNQFKKWNIFKSEHTLDFYVYLLVFIFIGLFIWLYYR